MSTLSLGEALAFLIKREFILDDESEITMNGDPDDISDSDSDNEVINELRDLVNASPDADTDCDDGETGPLEDGNASEEEGSVTEAAGNADRGLGVAFEEEFDPAAPQDIDNPSYEVIPAGKESKINQTHRIISQHDY